MMNAIARAGATATSFLIRAAIRPAFSATPTPIMATKITATTLKLAKFCTNEVKMKRIPSTESRLLISVVSSWISTSELSYDSGGTTASGCWEPGCSISSTGTGAVSATS